MPDSTPRSDAPQTRQERDIARRLRSAANAARDHLPLGYGVTLFVFPMDRPAEDTLVQYISTADRASMIEAVEVWLRRQKH